MFLIVNVRSVNSFLPSTDLIDKKMPFGGQEIYAPISTTFPSEEIKIKKLISFPWTTFVISLAVNV